MALLNRNNFIRWSNSTSELTLERVRLGASGQCNPMPLWVVGETMKVYFNSAAKSASTGTVALYTQAGSEAASNVGTLSNLAVVGGNHSYGTFTCPSVAAGLYYLKIGSIVSNLIRVVTAAPVESALVEFSHGGNLMSDAGSFMYKGTSIAQKFRLPLISLEFDFESSKEVYEEATTRNIRTNNQRLKKLLKFKCEYMEDMAIEALVAMLTHDTLTINGKTVRTKDGAPVELEFDPLEKLNHAYFSVYDPSVTLAGVI